MMRIARGRKDARSTPILSSGMGGFRKTLFSVLAAIAAPIIALAWFGQPALRMQYWYHGPLSSPVYERCSYLALDGWHVVIPRYGVAPGCPLVLMIPADLTALLRG